LEASSLDDIYDGENNFRSKIKRKNVVEGARSNQIIVEFLKRTYKNNVRFKIVCELCKVEGASLRELARRVGISHSNLPRHLDQLVEKGVVEYFYASPRVRIYRLSKKYEELKEILT